VTGQQLPDTGKPVGDPRLDTGVPHVARVYDYWLSGKDNFRADRVAGEEAIKVPSGSFLVISHAGTDLLPDDTAAFEKALNAHLPPDHHHVARSHGEVAALFDSVDLVEPGLVRVSDWRPDSPDEAATPTILWGGVAKKP
jgi:S-adenosyl methyltransferase